MTQSFDDYRSTLDTTQLLMSANCCRHAFEAGAQSKQAEIDEYKEVAESMDDAYLREKAKVDELLKIVKKLIDNTVIGIDDDVENKARDLLKGTNNE